MHRRNIWLLSAVVLAVLMAGAWGARTFAAQPSTTTGPTGTSSVQVRNPDEVTHALKSDTSRPLRDMTPLHYGVYNEDHDNPTIPHPGLQAGGVDNVIQRVLSPLVMPAPIQNFEGQYNQNGPLPPDTNGDVGRTQYVQIVNSTFQVWSKTGTSLYGPANNNTIFTGFGGPCETRNDGDPVALYDSLADRWVVTWFTSAAPYMECIAVSTSPDATGAWYRYAFLDHNSGTTLGDYPKMSVWPDAYYMTTNEFSPGFSGAGAYAYNRVKMAAGDPTAEMVYFHLATGGNLPADLDGSAPPPAGSPNYIMGFSGNSTVYEYRFHVDFVTPGNSTLTGPFNITVATFATPLTVPQPGTTTLLDTLGDRLMFRLAYRNMGTYEALVVNHTVNAGGVDGVRWYEFHDPNGTPSVFQQGTYAPADGLYRWMGSAAMDRAGDIAVGFSASSSTQFPSINYAGRLIGDPAGQLSQGEAVLQAGLGSEDFPSAHRWGDYSDLTVDPVDDCTFWYTTMYWGATNLRDWRTRIGSFKFPSCTAQGSPTPVSSPTGGVPTNTPVVATATPCAGSITYANQSITTGDPTQNGRLGLGSPASSCAVPKTVAAISDNLTRHYKSYTYTNSTAGAQCVTVSMTQACGNNAVQSIAYLGSYNPASIQTNYLADGAAAGPSFSYSFSLGAGQTAVIVVAEVSPNLGCATYNLTINPCGTAGLPTNTPSPVPSTPTRTTVAGTPTVTPTPGCTTVGTWSAGPPLSPGRYAIQAAVGTDGNVYVATGLDGASTPVPSQMNRYNPGTNSWSNVAAPPVAVGEYSEGAASGKVYLAGGFLGGTSITSTLQIYDITSNTWSFGASMPASVEAAAGVALNGKFYVVGGDDYNNSVRSTYIYDIASNTWTTGPQIPDTNGRTNTYATAVGGLVYVWGGVYISGGTNFVIDTIIAYNPGTNAWTTLASANAGGLGNYGAISPYGAGQLLATDGADATFNPSANTQIYHISTNTWTAGPTMLGVHAGHAQATLPDGRVFVYSGLLTGTTVGTTSELLSVPPCATPTTGPNLTPTATATTGPGATATPTVCASGPATWTDVTHFPTTRGRAVGVNFGNFIYTFGGRPDNTTYTQDIYRYDLTAGTWTLLPQQFPDLMSSNMSAGVLNFPAGPRILIAGGSGTGSVFTSRATIFDPATGTFTSAAAWPAAPLRLPGGWAVANNKFYILGGIDTTGAGTGYADIWAYDPTTNTWAQSAASLSLARGYIATELMPDGLIYAAGGSANNAGTLTDETAFDKFNPTTNVDTAGPPLLVATSNNSGYNFGGIFLVPGGGIVTLGNQVQSYNPSSNSWSTTTYPAMLFPVRNYSKGYGLNGSIHAIGGLDLGATTFYDYNQKLSPGACGTASPTPTVPIGATATATSTTTSNTPTRTAVSATQTPTVVATVTACPIQFTDVLPADPFYSYIRCLACRNIISGYTTTPPCATGQTPCYNGGANVTRGQVAKIVSNAAGYNDPIPSTTQTFTDVPYTNPFWVYIERLAEPGRGFISGYSTSPPCTTGTPCFLPFNNVTRGQMAKIDSNAGGFFDAIPSTQQTFTDVPYSNPFWVYIERAALHGVISGYSTSPPCPGGTPCFLWANNLTRNQAAKIVAVTFFPNCQTPVRTGHPANQ